MHLICRASLYTGANSISNWSGAGGARSYVRRVAAWIKRAPSDVLAIGARLCGRRDGGAWVLTLHARPEQKGRGVSASACKRASASACKRVMLQGWRAARACCSSHPPSHWEGGWLRICIGYIRVPVPEIQRIVTFRAGIGTVLFYLARM